MAMQNENTICFNEHWPVMLPIIRRSIHVVCLWDAKGPSKLMNHLQEFIVEYIEQALSKLLAHQEDQALLKAYLFEWRKFFEQCTYLPMPFYQVEGLLIGKPTVFQRKVQKSVILKLMVDSWNQHLFANIKQRLRDSAMKLIHSERNGEAFDSHFVIGVRKSFIDLSLYSEYDILQIYRENYEAAYIDTIKAFYREKAPEYIEANGIQNYMHYANQKLKEEEERGLKYLEPFHSNLVLNECCVQYLVTVFKEAILAECPGMIRNKETEMLQLMLRLLDRVPDGITPMLKHLEQHIVQQGLADMLSNANEVTQDSERYIEQLLDLFTNFSKLVREAFNDDPRFLTSRDKAFKQVVNDTSVFRLQLPLKQKGKTLPESRCPELLANYCDLLLRKTPLSKKLTSDEIESRLKDVLLVLKYVQNKDVFMRYHKAHLTRRLILNSSADSEKEENMVQWLRDVGMPADYVNRLARMFQDVKVSEDLNQLFKDCQRNKGTLTDSVNIKVLNTGAWARGSERVQVSLPLELEDIIPEIEEFYKQKHNGRKLQWYHHMSNGTITFSNKVGKFDLDVTTFQMAVLFAWNQRSFDRISFENLRLATELPDAELRRTLWSLVNFPKLKHQVLLCAPEVKTPKEFDNNTQFWVNQEFCFIRKNTIQKRGKLNLIGRLQLSTEKSKEEDNESIVQLRMLRIQEAIVKIMKMRKKVTHAQLQTELVEILKNMFLPTKKMIKEQIEWLIEHNYIKRDKKNVNIFFYVA
ncbi:cullin-5 [Caerostris darwini]|uniref:Cullin-5 n=1 Tax=Caerostris darwini TaxID=1538125 RepID=A0AAV4QH22_9ARAC|nr:cullin-5 [Caerostris darwini]